MKVEKRIIKKGFTLIEILVVTTLIGIVVATATQLFARILRANQKARAILEVKQQGDSALAVMANKIRNAKRIDTDLTDICAETPSSSHEISIINNDETETTTTFSCSSGRIVIDSTQFLTSAEITATCATMFTCYTDPSGGPETVEISFSLVKSGETTPLNFSTTVSLRNY